MSEIEKMKRYIERTKQKNADKYQMNFSEACKLSDAACESRMDALILAFDYGRAKGYRQAKAEVRK